MPNPPSQISGYATEFNYYLEKVFVYPTRNCKIKRNLYSKCVTLPACAVFHVNVVGAGPVDAVPLVATHSGLTQPCAGSEVAPVAVDYKRRRQHKVINELVLGPQISNYIILSG